MSALASPIPLPASPAAEQRFMLTGCDWQAYERMLAAMQGRHVRVTYNQGTLEIMTVSAWHEICKRLLSNMIDELIDATGLDACPVGNTTWRRQAAGRGLEPDDGWYIASAARIKGKTSFDLAIDPPPDLMLEIEVSRSAVDRMSIYAQFGVPGVWRCDGKTVRFEVLQGGRYEEEANSFAFPALKSADLSQFLSLRQKEHHTTVMREFRSWVKGDVRRQNL